MDHFLIFWMDHLKKQASLNLAFAYVINVGNKPRNWALVTRRNQRRFQLTFQLSQTFQNVVYAQCCG